MPRDHPEDVIFQGTERQEITQGGEVFGQLGNADRIGPDPCAAVSTLTAGRPHDV